MLHSWRRKMLAQLFDIPESAAVCESVERGGDSEEEEQRETVNERTDLLYGTRGH